MRILFYKAIIALLITSLLHTNAAMAQVMKPAKDFLGIAGPLSFNNQSYRLAWSSHPAVDFYKQEYLQKGANPDKYLTMLLIDVITGSQDIKDIVETKIAELKRMKLSNPVINYDVIQNPKSGEYIIDFLLTANAADGTISIVEHNVYRSALFAGNSGIKGIQLFGISNRAYGSEIDGFLVKLKANRKTLINQIVKSTLPVINIK